MRSDRRSTLFSLLIRNLRMTLARNTRFIQEIRKSTKGHGYSGSEKLAQYEMIDKKIQKGPGKR